MQADHHQRSCNRLIDTSKPTLLVTLAANKPQKSRISYLTKPFADVKRPDGSHPLTPDALEKWSRRNDFYLEGTIGVSDTKGNPWAVGIGHFTVEKTQRQRDALGVVLADPTISLGKNAKRAMYAHGKAPSR